MYPGIHALTASLIVAAIIMTGSGETVTYAELADRSLRLANWLHDAGLRRGDVVGDCCLTTIPGFSTYTGPRSARDCT